MAPTVMLIVALTLAALVWRLTQVREPLVVAERGILDRRLGVGWILWDEIEGAWRPRDEAGDRIRLRLRVSRRLSRVLGRRLGTPLPRAVDIPVDLDGTHLTGIELLQEILAHPSARR